MKSIRELLVICLLIAGLATPIFAGHLEPPSRKCFATLAKHCKEANDASQKAAAGEKVVSNASGDTERQVQYLRSHVPLLVDEYKALLAVYDTSEKLLTDPFHHDLSSIELMTAISYVKQAGIAQGYFKASKRAFERSTTSEPGPEYLVNIHIGVNLIRQANTELKTVIKEMFTSLSHLYKKKE